MWILLAPAFKIHIYLKKTKNCSKSIDKHIIL